MPRNSTIGFVIVLAVAPMSAQQPANGPGPPASRSADRALAYMDRSEKELGLLLEAIQSGDRAEIQSALDAYRQAFSRFHVEFARLPVGKQDQNLLARVVDRLQQQMFALELLAEKIQPDLRVALNQAASHQKSALGLAELKLDMRRRNTWSQRMRIYAPLAAGAGVAGGLGAARRCRRSYGVAVQPLAIPPGN